MTNENSLANNDQSDDLILAAKEIFGEAKNEVKLRSGKVCVILPAKVKQLGMVIDFFRSIITGIDPETLAALIEAIVERQQALIEKQQDPNKVDLEELSALQLVNNVMGKVNMATMLFATVLDKLPELAPAFTNLTAEEYGDCNIDEGVLIAGGVFTINYDFFTQTLPPILTAFIGSRAGQIVQPSLQKAVATAAKARILKRR